jgi:hypothetical protein
MHHHQQQRNHLPPTLHHHHQQHSPHDLGGGGFMGITTPSSSQPFGGLGTPDGIMTSPLDANRKRPDSLCSNSNDSGLSDVNCNFASSAEAAAAAGLDGGYRPKIWSLAHVATSDNSASPYLNSGPLHSGMGLGPGARGMGMGGGCGMAAPRSPSGMDGGKMMGGMGSPPGMQPWGPSSLSSSSSPVSSIPSSASSSLYPPRSFGGMGGMNMNSLSPKGGGPPSLASPMFSHPFPGMHSQPPPPANNGGYGQLSSFGYPQPKLSVD